MCVIPTAWRRARHGKEAEISEEEEKALDRPSQERSEEDQSGK
jgi:hypothetical protein